MEASLRYLWLILAISAGAFARTSASASTGAEGERFFEEKVRPILVANCVKCHGGEKTKGGLKLTSRESILAGGEIGPAVVSGKPADSKLIEAIGYKNEKLQMPPSGKLPMEQIDVLTKWVEMGLPWGKTPIESGAPSAQPVGHGVPKVDEKARQFWSFRKLERPEVPTVKDSSWVQNPIDAFILAKLEAKEFAPAKPADRVTLIRRATYDLTGLPPTPAAVESFLKDARPDAYARLIDRLLASPRYGEKWGRHWLDLVRFAETNSYERDGRKPNAWRFRDYVIRSFNEDKPYDRFIKEQLAGDEMPETTANPDPIIATGFYRLGIWDDEPVDKEQARYDGLDDIVATVGQVFLGITIDCARCHDHKIDPVPQRDYYKLLAFFQNITDYRNGGAGDEVPVHQHSADREAFASIEKERALRLDAVRAAIKEAEANFLQLLEGEPGIGRVDPTDAAELIKKHGKRVLGKERAKQYADLRDQFADLKKPAEGPTALCVTERGPKPADTFVLIRGSAHSPGPKVEPGFLEVLANAEPVIPTPPPGAKSTGRRTVLADWIASKDNHLTARVMANRIWQYHFGRGIVRSSSNFGYQGDPPTHPELLDWLASEFQSRGWSMKQFHRLIMTSSAYQMSSSPNDNALATDPRNDLFWRFDMRRLAAEEIRDSILSLNGTLNLKMFGESVYPTIPKEVLAGQSVPGSGWKAATPKESARRSVYIFAKRSLRVPIIEAFDGAETDKSCPVRFVTVQPTQALGMLNGEFLNFEAQNLANRLRKEAGDDLGKQMTLAFKLVTSREPTKAEVERGEKLVKSLIANEHATPENALKYACLVLLNLNEFVYLD